MSYPAQICTPDTSVEMTDSAFLAALKEQMNGLTALFGTALPAEPQAHLSPNDHETAAVFENLPV